MKAWRIDGFGSPLDYRDVAVPDVRPGSVLVRIETSALMSYLKDYVEGRLKTYLPPKGAFTPGGNGFGVVEAVGRDVWHLKPGQKVLLSSHLVASDNVADKGQILIGITRFGGVGEVMQADWPDGTLADYALFPVSAVTPVDSLDHVPAEQLSIVSRCVIPYGGLVRGRLAAGETIIINGITGAYGTAAALVALAMGAGRVIGAGRNTAKLEAIDSALGGRITTVAMTGDINTDTQALRAAAGGGAELAFDMVGQAGDANATLAALGSLRRNGRLVLMGSMTASLPLNYLQLMGNNLEVIGHFMYEADAHLKVLNLLRTGRLDLGPIKPDVYPMADLPVAMEAARLADSLTCVIARN
ncbi:MAG: zinc-binding dehydrogenase [Bradyrhizobium sp.]|nr:zinc-binding dehydrogenase [Bradyrhizobium sp.]